MKHNKLKNILEKTGKIVCANFIPWLCCAVFMLPALPVSSIFIHIMKDHLLIEEQFSSFIGMILFMIIATFPIFLIPQHECKRRGK